VIYQQASTQAGDWLLDTVQRKPEALLLIAAGCALLMRSAEKSVAVSSVRWDGASAAAGDRLGSEANKGSIVDSAKTYASTVGDAVSEYTDTARRTASGYAEEAKRGISDGSDWLRTQAETTYRTASETLREQPLLVAALGLAAGAALAAFFPTTEVERRASAALAAKASEVGDNVLAATQKAGERLKDTVAEHGLDPAIVKDVAREVAGIATAAIGLGEARREEPQPAIGAEPVIGTGPKTI
jgi:hypothetical protein